MPDNDITWTLQTGVGLWVDILSLRKLSQREGHGQKTGRSAVEEDSEGNHLCYNLAEVLPENLVLIQTLLMKDSQLQQIQLRTERTGFWMQL